MSTISDRSETIYIGCQCGATEHIIRVNYYDWQERDEPELYFALQSDKGHLNFWSRLKMAFGFIIGRCDVEWHDVIPDHNDVVNLHRVLTNYQNSHKLYITSVEDKKNGQ